MRATAEPQSGRRAARPGQQQRLAEAVGPQAVVDGVGAQPVLEAQALHLADGAGGEPVTAGLVAREDLRVDEHRVEPGAGAPGRGRRAGGPGADDEDVGRCGGAHEEDSPLSPQPGRNRRSRGPRNDAGPRPPVRETGARSVTTGDSVLVGTEVEVVQRDGLAAGLPKS